MLDSGSFLSSSLLQSLLLWCRTFGGIANTQHFSQTRKINSYQPNVLMKCRLWNSTETEDSARGTGQRATAWNSRGAGAKHLGWQPTAAKRGHSCTGQSAGQQTPEAIRKYMGGLKTLQTEMDGSKEPLMGWLIPLCGTLCQHWVNSFIELVVPKQGLCKKWQDIDRRGHSFWRQGVQGYIKFSNITDKTLGNPSRKHLAKTFQSRKYLYLPA